MTKRELFILLLKLLAAVAILLTVCSLPSCRTIKEVTKYEYIKDSTAEKEVARLQQILTETTAKLQRLQSDSTGIRIEFETRPVTDTIRLVGDTIFQNKIIIDKSGQIQAEGRLKSVQVSNTRLLQENSELKTQVDNLAMELDKEKHTVKTTEKIVTKYVKRAFPWWWIICGAIAGYFIRHYNLLYAARKILLRK